MKYSQREKERDERARAWHDKLVPQKCLVYMFAPRKVPYGCTARVRYVMYMK